MMVTMEAAITVDRRHDGTTQLRGEFVANLSSSEIEVGGRFRSSGTERTSRRDEFRERLREWQDATGHLSAPSRIYSHPTYLRLFMLGPSMIPLILEDIRDGAMCDWYRTLRLLTEDDPVTDAERGKVDLMDAAWLQWGRDHEYIA